MMRNTNKRLKLFATLTFAGLLSVIFFGLRGNGFHFSNDVTWLKTEPGIRFRNFGIAHALLDHESIKNNISILQTFSIEIAIKPEDLNTDGFNLILTFHDGKDGNQLIIGQYNSCIIAMNGDDYENKRKIKRISSNIFSQQPDKLLLTITTGATGTKLYMNGKLMKYQPDLILKIPERALLKITLGNSVYGHSPWRGEVYGLAFYRDRLESETIKNRFHVWLEKRRFPFPKDGNPVLFFPFHEMTGTEVTDHIMGIQKLSIPSGFPILEKRFLAMPWQDFKVNKSYFMDFIVNLLGFIPLGLTLCALLIQSGGFFRKKAILLSVIFCFWVSFCIEIAQAWMPSRSSQGIDLILNSIGALIGALLCKLLFSGTENADAFFPEN